MYITRLLFGAAVVTTGLFGSPVSLADTPVIWRETNDFDLLIAECGAFDVHTSGIERDTYKLWFDKSGEPVRLQWHINVTESRYYNYSEPTKFITQGKKGVGEGQTYDFDLTNCDVAGDPWSGSGCDEHFSGGAFRITIPGIGRVLWDAGTWFWDQSEGMLIHHGPAYVFAEGDTGLALCEALE